jgi:putative redox protein
LLAGWQDIPPAHRNERVAMSDSYRVETRSVDGGPTALGSGGSVSVVIDRPVEAGGRGIGFSGGQLLNLAVAGCISNDLFREAARRGIRLERVRVTAQSDYVGHPAVSTPIEYTVELTGDADDGALTELVAHVDRIAEIPNSIRNGTPVVLRSAG